MNILRTPDQRFAAIEDYPFAAHYTTIDAGDGTALRIHHIDEGDSDAPVILCLHGQPTWSYLYRKMIAPLCAAGCRVIAPDLPGYGKSDKPAAREDYSYQRQVDWMTAWLDANDLHNITFFGQDWGGLIGLRMVVARPERFAGVIISNTGLPLPGPLDDAVVQRVRDYRASAPTPGLLQMAAKLQDIPHERAEAFAVWQKFCWETAELPIGLMMSTTVERRAGLRQALNVLWYRLFPSRPSPFATALSRAYDAPFPSAAFKMAARAMPSHVPTLPDDPSMEAQRAAWAFFDTFDKPFLCAFTDDDPITRGGDREFIARVPGAASQPHTEIRQGGHFVQERQPEALAQLITDFVRRYP